MIYTLLRRDITWYITLAMMVVGGVFGALTNRYFLFLFNIYIPCILVAKPNQRATLFEASLPIAARDLYLSRTISLLAMVILPVGTACLARMIAQGAVGWGDSLTSLGVGAVLCLVLLFTISGRIEELRSNVWLLPVMLLVLILATALLTTRPDFAAAVLVISVTLGVFWFWKTWESVPPSFQVAPFEVSEASPASRDSGMFFPEWTILRSLAIWQNIVWLPLIAMQAFTGEWMVGCLFAVSYVASTMSRLSWLFTLPISRRTLFSYLMAPLVVALALGFAAHTTLSFESPVRIGVGEILGASSYVDKNATPSVQVPMEFWHWSRNDSVPEIRAPWGETHVPPTSKLLGWTYYNPYSVGPRRSGRFLEWQLENATEAILGHRFTMQDYQEGRLSPDRLQQAGWLPLTRQPRFLILEFMGMGSFLLLLTCGAELSVSYRVNRLDTAMRRTVVWGMSLLPAALIVLMIVGPGSNGSRHVNETLFRKGLLWVSGVLPAGIGLVVAFAVVVLGLLSWLAYRMFEDVEILTVTPRNNTLWSQAVQGD